MADPVLETTALSKSFGALKVADAVSLTLLPGEIHALIGPNGAGKSTLMRLLAGEMRADAGTVRFSGRNIDEWDGAARARAGLARTFQVSQVVPEFSALLNVMLAVQGAGDTTFRFVWPARRDRGLREPSQDAILKAGLVGREDVPAMDLSHGERRRLEIAIALALRPKAFLLDEPMAGMGPEGSKDLADLLDQLRHRAPILLVEHDMDAVFRLADRISVLVNGRIIASGGAEEIRADTEVRRSYLGEDQ